MWRRGSRSAQGPGWASPGQQTEPQEGPEAQGSAGRRAVCSRRGQLTTGLQSGGCLGGRLCSGGGTQACVHPKAQDSPPSQALWTEPEPSWGLAGGREPLLHPRNWGRASPGPLALGSPLAVVSGPVPHTAGPTATPPLWPGSHHSSHKGTWEEQGGPWAPSPCPQGLAPALLGSQASRHRGLGGPEPEPSCLGPHFSSSAPLPRWCEHWAEGSRTGVSCEGHSQSRGPLGSWQVGAQPPAAHYPLTSPPSGCDHLRPGRLIKPLPPWSSHPSCLASLRLPAPPTWGALEPPSRSFPPGLAVRPGV